MMVRIFVLCDHDRSKPAYSIDVNPNAVSALMQDAGGYPWILIGNSAHPLAEPIDEIRRKLEPEEKRFPWDEWGKSQQAMR